jgi:hypothetical protein
MVAPVSEGAINTQAAVADDSAYEGNHQASVDAHQLAASRSLKVATTALP